MAAEQPENVEEEVVEYKEDDGGHLPVTYMAEDLINFGSNLAYKALVAKHEKEILDTRFHDCKVLIKDNRSRI